MSDSPRSNRPTPRTGAAIEAELRRRIRTELAQARSEADDGQLSDAALANVIAEAIASALGWHLESPEHVRNSTYSSRTWRPAGGPRAGRPSDAAEDDEEEAGGRGGPRSFGPRPSRDFGDRPGPRPFGPGAGRESGDRPPRDFGNRPPRDFGDRPPRDFGNRPPRDFGDRPPRDFGNRPPRDFGDRPRREGDFGDPRRSRERDDDQDQPRRGPGRAPFSPRGGRPNRGGPGGGFSRGGGFGPRRPPRPR